MEASYEEFPEDGDRTASIQSQINQCGLLFPVFIKENDPSLFIMEGRHRIVSFAKCGLKSVPVMFVS